MALYFAMGVTDIRANDFEAVGLLFSTHSVRGVNQSEVITLSLAGVGVCLVSIMQRGHNKHGV
jgi:hypothetical protein